MRAIPLLVLSLLLSLVEEVHCQQTFPHVSFMNENLADHSYVDITTVGSYVPHGVTVLCHTDLSMCCSNTEGLHRGDWYFPNGIALPFWRPSLPISEGRGAQLVAIHRTTATVPTGIYRCDIPTVLVHNDTDIFVRETVYVGLYGADGGMEVQLTYSSVISASYRICHNS